jgi:transposase
MTKIHKRGRYSAALKEKVSLEALKGDKTLQRIASENNISPELVRQWKKEAQEGYLKSSSVAKAAKKP